MAYIIWTFFIVWIAALAGNMALSIYAGVLLLCHLVKHG
jgi:hypothetical protein